MAAGQLNRNERGLPKIDKTTLIQSAWCEGATLLRHTADDAQSALRVWHR